MPLALDQLPPPPDWVANLIQSAEVKFERGSRSSDSTANNSTANNPAEDSLRGIRITAETRYRIAYHYDNHSRWQIRRGRDGTRRVTVRTRFDEIRWQPSHEIWLESPPLGDRFWDDSLVLHELDHVRISADPRWRRQFEQQLQQNTVLQRELTADEVVDGAAVNRWVDQQVESIFNEISELIAIRYRELDRLTLHGRRPLPDDSELVPPLSEP